MLILGDTSTLQLPLILFKLQSILETEKAKAREKWGRVREGKKRAPFACVYTCMKNNTSNNNSNNYEVCVCVGGGKERWPSVKYEMQDG